MNMWITAAFILGLLWMGLWIFWAVRYRKRMADQMELLLNRLDEVLSGKEQQVSWDESMDSAIGERLNRLLWAFQADNARARQEKEGVKSLLSDISHQVRTPLSNILLYAGLLREREGTEEEKKMAEKIQSQAEKLDFFMKELIRSSYLETDMIAVKPEPASVEELIDRVCQGAEVLAMEKSIAFDINISQGQAVFDMKWTQEALGNILDNAIKYSPSGSTVILSSREFDSFVAVEIRDQGMGIPEKELGMIFTRFYRSPRVAQTRGLGIGLYLAREILQKQGGYIKVNSVPGQGSGFSVFLPKRGFGR